MTLQLRAESHLNPNPARTLNSSGRGVNVNVAALQDRLVTTGSVLKGHLIKFLDEGRRYGLPGRS